MLAFIVQGVPFSLSPHSSDSPPAGCLHQILQEEEGAISQLLRLPMGNSSASSNLLLALPLMSFDSMSVLPSFQ